MRNARVPVDDVMVAVLDVIDRNGGRYRADPGRVISGIAQETQQDYFAVALAIRLLEDMELVRVDRSSRKEAHRGNRVEQVSLYPV